MKNVFKALSIVAIAAVIVFSMVACEDGVGGPGGGGTGGTGGGGGSSGDVGMLTITGLPYQSGDWWWANVYADGADLSSMDAYNDIYYSGKFEAAGSNYKDFRTNTFHLGPAEGASTGYDKDGRKGYAGSGRKDVVIDYNGGVSFYWAKVNFSNGNVTVPFGSFTYIGSHR